MTSFEVVRQGLRELGLDEQRIDDMFAMELKMNPHSELDRRCQIPDDQIPHIIALVKRMWHVPPSVQNQMREEAERNIARFAEKN